MESFVNSLFSAAVTHTRELNDRYFAVNAHFFALT